jgi:hypothetical protein
MDKEYMSGEGVFSLAEGGGRDTAEIGTFAFAGYDGGMVVFISGESGDGVAEPPLVIGEPGFDHLIGSAFEFGEEHIISMDRICLMESEDQTAGCDDFFHGFHLRYLGPLRYSLRV